MIIGLYAQDFSTIAVYHHTDVPSEQPWSLGLRMCFDKQTPALFVPMESGSAYYLLGNFNHHHQHVVVSGDTRRYR